MPPRAGSQRAWWADVEEVRERIEGRRATERPLTRRTVSITGHPSEHVPALRLVRDVPEQDAPPPVRSRRRPPLRAVERIGSRPDRIASWAVLLGIVLVVVTLLSTHS